MTPEFPNPNPSATQDILLRQNRYLDALQKTALSLASRLDLNELLQDILARAGELTGTAHGYVFMLDPEADEMVMRVGVGTYESFVGTRARRGVGLAGQVWEQGAPVVVDDYRAWGGRLADASRDVLRAVIGVPLMSHTQVAGVLGLAYLEPDKTFGEAEQDVLSRFAALASVALSNAQLYQTSQRDLAQRERAERFLDSILENLPTMLFIKDADELRFVRWNRAGEEITGRARDEFLGKNDYDFFPKEEADFFVAKDRQALSSPVPLEIPEEPLQRANGEVRWLHTRKVPIYGADNKPAFLLGISEDITERKRVEDALRESEGRYRDLFENANDLIQSIHADGHFDYVNRKWQEALGYSDEDLKTMTFIDVIHPDERQHCVALFGRVMAGEAVNDIATAFIAKDGRKLLIEGSTSPRFEDGRVVSTRGIFRDVTERKRSEQDLMRFRRIIEQLTDAVFMTDPQGTIVYVNAAFEKIYGYSADEAIGSTPRIIKSGLMSLEQYQYFWATLLSGQAVSGEITNRTKSGDLISIEGTNVPIVDESKNIIGFVAVHHDLTERIRAEQKVRRNEALYESLVQTIPQALARKDAQGRIVFANARFFEDTQQQPENIYGKTDFDIHPRELAEKYWQDDLRVLNGETVDVIEPHVRGDGREITVRVIKSPMRNAAGDIDGIQVMFWDISDEQAQQEQIRRQNAYLSTLQETSLGLVGRLDVNDLLQDIVARAGTLVGTENGYVFIREPGAPEMELRVGVGAYEGFVGRRTQRGVGLAGEVWLKNEPVVVDDYRQYGGRLADASRDILRAVVGVPLRSGADVIGVIGLAYLDETQKFGAEEILVLERFAQLAAIALDNARLYESAQQELTERTRAENALAQQLRETELVNRVTRHAVSFDVNKALMEICRDLAAYFQVEQTGIALLSQDRQSLTVVADHSPENATSVVGYVIPVEGNPSTEIVLETRRPAAFSDAQNDPRLASIRDLMVARKTVSILIAPLFVRDEIIGTVGIDSFTPREFTASDIALLEQVANAVSTALENARLYNTAQQELAERTRVEQQMRQRNLELEALNRVAGTMMMNVPLETSLAQMARELVNTFRARNCGIALLNAERDALTVVADALPLGHPQQSVGIVIPIAGNASSEYVVQNKISLVVDDPQTNPLTQSIHERMRDRHMTCLAIIPLLSGEQVIGTIGLDTTEPGRVFSADEVHVAETMASQMASAIEKQRLLEATQREVIQRTRAERIQVALFRIADAANIAETTPEFYAILHEVIAEVVYAPNMYVALYHPAEDALEFAYFKDEHDELAAPFRRRSPAGKSITAWVIKQGQPLLGDAETFTLMQARGEVEMRGNPPVEWLGIPLKRGGETFGMFTVQSYSTEHVYAAHDLELLLTLAPEIANAITRREEQEALVRRNRELAVLNRVTQVASTGMELSDTLGTVAREMVDIFQARNCGIALLTPEQTELVVVASATRSPDEPNTVGVRIPVQNNPSTERVLETRASLVIENAQTDPLTARIHALMRERNTQALMIVPLLSGGQIIGTVGLDLTEPERMFAPEDVRLAETIANQMANAVEKQHLFEQTQSALQQTQDALVQVNQAQNRLALQFQTAQLLAGASSFDEVSSPLLESICRALNWQVGEFWTINEENATATLQHVWSMHEPELHAFTRGAVGSTYPRGGGLVGETWAARAPVWIENLQTDARFKDPALAIRAGLVTAFGFPVVSDTHAFGIATFFSKQHQVLDEALMATMSGVGSQIVQFLQRREAEEFVRQQNTFLMAMHDMTIGLMRRVNLDEVLESIIARAAELVRTEHGYVHLVEPGGVELRMRVGVGLYQDFIGTRVKRGQGLAGTVWQSGAPLVVEDYQKYPGRLPMVDRDVLRAVVGVPLMSGDQIAGVLGLASLTEGRVFTRAQVEALKRFAELASVAIDNARLHESTQTALDQTRRAAEREKASSEIAERLYAEPDIKYVLQTAADELRRATGSKRATVRIKLGSNGEAALTNAPAPNGDE